MYAFCSTGKKNDVKHSAVELFDIPSIRFIPMGGLPTSEWRVHDQQEYDPDR
jgi:hypothetical protein